MKKWYQYTNEQVAEHFQTDINTGLTSNKAEEKLKEHGKNVFAKQEKESLISAIIHQFKDISTLILLFAAVLALLLAIRDGHGYVEAIVIFGIIIMNMFLAISQERRAEQALEALQNMNSPTCTVIRDGVQIEIDTSMVVPGDTIVLSLGSLVSADARLISSASLEVDEAALTGESEPAEKDAAAVLSGKASVGDQSNMVFSGTLVTGGQAVAIVTGTGMNSEMGRIAGYLNDTKKLKTPLQTRLDKIGKFVSGMAITAAIILLVVGMLQGEDFWSMILLAVSLAVAAVPEMLNLIVTLSLTNGVHKMVNRNALIRKLSAVETLGNTSVICSDKTGTLTQNRMRIKKLWLQGEKKVSGSDQLGEQHTKFLRQLAMASNAVYEAEEDGNIRYMGNPTEKAILRLLHEVEEPAAAELENRAAEIPFSSERKMMTVVMAYGEKDYLILTKGALDRLPLKDGIPPRAVQVHDELAGDAFRVLALASKKVTSIPENIEELEENLELVGLIGLIDPPRPEVTEAIDRAKRAGIRTVMITGDHAVTAGAIAGQIGILNKGERVLTGAELDDMGDEDFMENVAQYSVYARVSPENKIRIVKAWQKQEAVVAMTGDGVNDAPALKAADVGIAMGQTGTEVAKSASDMILTDDNFATIVDAVEEGRNVYTNIKKVIYFLLVVNISEIIGMLFAQMAGWGILVTPVLLLLINVLGDGIPGLYLAKETSDAEIMNRGPIKRNESFFADGLAGLIAVQTAAATAVMLAAFYIGKFVLLNDNYPAGEALGQTLAFLVLGWSSIIHIFTVRSRKSVFRHPIKDNIKLTYSALAMLVLFAAMVAIPPFGKLFGLVAIGPLHWVIAVLLSVVPIAIAEVVKAIEAKKGE